MAKTYPRFIITPDGARHKIPTRTPAGMRAVLRPYITELGYLAASWNQLQHNLSSLFSLLVTPGRVAIGQAVWYAAESDFVQRKMLRAFVTADQGLLPQDRKLSSEQAKGILWLLDQVDSGLRHKRNNAIHAPLMVLTQVIDNSVKTWVEAHFNPYNPRAKPLRGKDLVEEFQSYTAQADILAAHAALIFAAIDDPARNSWPDKPPSPQAHKKKRKRRRGKHLLPPHRLGSS